MDIEKSIEHICKSVKTSPTKNISSVFSEAFNASGHVALLQKRAFFIEHCQKAMKELDVDEEEYEAFEALFIALCHHNLNAQIVDMAPHFTKAHSSMVKRLFAMHKYIKKEHEVDDIVDLSDTLKESAEQEDLTKEQHQIVLEICEAVEQAKVEHEMVGSLAIKKLMDILMGKLTIHKETLSKIKSQTVKDKLKKLYLKVEEVNKVMGFLLTLKSSATSLLSMF